MSSSRASFVAIVCVFVTPSLVASCADGPSADPAPAAFDVRVAALTPAEKVQQRKAACAKDPRVLTGLVSQDICVGADIFLRETFDGNGRTCGTCHPPQNNFTIDAPFISTLPPSDPLFVFKTNTALTELEREPSLLLGGILENVDDPGTPSRIRPTSSRSAACPTCCRCAPASPPTPATQRDHPAARSDGLGRRRRRRSTSSSTPPSPSTTRRRSPA